MECVQKGIINREVCPLSECPLSEVSLYILYNYKLPTGMSGASNGPYAIIKFQITHVCAAQAGNWAWGHAKNLPEFH